MFFVICGTSAQTKWVLFKAMWGLLFKVSEMDTGEKRLLARSRIMLTTLLTGFSVSSGPFK